MRLSKLLLCGAVALALAFPVSFAEDASVEETPVPTEVPKSTETPTPTPEPTEVPMEASTETPTEAPTEAPAEVPTEAPTETPTEAPTGAPTETPTATPPIAPTELPSEEPTAAPGESPTVSPSSTPIPQPGEIGDLVSITPEGNAQQKEGVWQIIISSPDAAFSFSWTVATEAVNCLVYTSDSAGALSFIQETADAHISLSPANYGSGRCTIYVGAVLADGSINWGSAIFELTTGMGGKPGGMSGRPSSMGGGRPGRGGADMSVEEQGFHVTPGEALTSDHAKGNKDMTRYTDADIHPGDDPVTALVLGMTQTEITLDGGSSAFTVQTDETKLILNPVEQGSEWEMSVLALNVLSASGYERIALTLGTTDCSLSTQMEFSGQAYAALRAEGFVDKDFVLHITNQGVTLSVAGANYSINEDGTLVPLER